MILGNNVPSHDPQSMQTGLGAAWQYMVAAGTAVMGILKVFPTKGRVIRAEQDIQDLGKRLTDLEKDHIKKTDIDSMEERLTLTIHANHAENRKTIEGAFKRLDAFIDTAAFLKDLKLQELKKEDNHGTTPDS